MLRSPLTATGHQPRATPLVRTHGMASAARLVRACGWAALGLVLAASRLLARQATVWEWDDVVFGVSLHVFAPDARVPHPPYYPVYVGLGRLARLLVPDDTAALTLLGAVASCAALAFVFLLARELLADARVAATAAVVFAFFPAVWLHAGVPLSDPPGLAAGLGAAWLALAARRRPDLLWRAGLVFGVACGVRPQAALVALGPLLLAAWKAPRRDAVFGLTAAAGCAVAGLVAPVVLASRDLAVLWQGLRYQSGFVVNVDSLAAHSFDVAARLRRFGVDLWAYPALAVLCHALAVAGAVMLWRERRRRELAWLVAAFAPYALAALVMLDPATMGRYALPVLPAWAVLGAVALARAERAVVPRGAPVLAAALVAALAIPVWPALRVVHTLPSPPVVAAHAIRAGAGPAPFRVAYRSDLFVFAETLFSDVPRVKVRTRADLGALPADPLPLWLYGFGCNAGSGGVAAWPDLPVLRRVGRGRYLSVPYGRCGDAGVRQ